MATHKFKIDGKDFEVQVGTRVGSQLDVTVNGRKFAVEVEQGAAAAPAPVAPAAPAAAPPRAAVAAPAAAAPVATGGSGQVCAPISGVVLSVEVKAGDKVEPHTKVVVLEAMKMENEIFAATTGTVAQVHAQPQQEVREGDLLITVTPA